MNSEIKHQAVVFEIFPNPAALLQLADAAIVKSHDQWQVTRHYFTGYLDG